MFLPVSVSVSLNLRAVHPCHMSCYMWFCSCMWKPTFLQFTAGNNSFPTKLTQMWFLSSVYHVVNPETAGITEAYAAHSTCILPIIAITDRWAWLVRHSTRHCAHMKSVDNRFRLISSHWGLTNKMFPVTGWRVFLIILQQRKKFTNPALKQPTI
jgi:hypothetical protein